MKFRRAGLILSRLSAPESVKRELQPLLTKAIDDGYVIQVRHRNLLEVARVTRPGVVESFLRIRWSDRTGLHVVRINPNASTTAQ